MEKFINEILAKFGGAAKELVYLSVTPGVGLEAIQIDPTIKSVKAYGYRPLEYNESKREIENYDEFKKAFEEILTEMKIGSKCTVILNLPTVYVGKMELALLLNDDSITEALTSDAEQSYIFKRNEPIISWFDATTNSSSETRTVFYGAVQKAAVDKIKALLEEMGATLGGLEISLISVLRALDYAELAEVQMTENMPWNLMLVNQNGYSIFAMSGKNITDSYEEPIPLKTYEAEEVYDAIAQSAQLALMGLPASYLYIISETDLVSAELLSSKINFEGKIENFENNSFRKRDILPVSLNVIQENISKISLEAIGVGLTRISPYPVKLEFTGAKETEVATQDASVSFELNGKEITLTEKALRMMALVAAGVIVAVLLFAMLFLQSAEKKNKAELDRINKEIQTVEGEIKKLKDEASHTGFVARAEIETVLKNNRSKLMAYSALGTSVPKGLWLTYFMTKNDGKVDIKGVGESVEDIYLFFKNLKDSLIDQQLKLYKLEMLSSSIETAVEFGGVDYEFEITNMSPEDLSAPAATSDANPEEQQGQKQDGKSKNKFSEILPQVNLPMNK